MHPLDIGVSGVLVLATGGGAARRLMRAFEEGAVKIYVARVLGRLESDETIVEIRYLGAFRGTLLSAHPCAAVGDSIEYVSKTSL